MNLAHSYCQPPVLFQALHCLLLVLLHTNNHCCVQCDYSQKKTKHLICYCLLFHPVNKSTDYPNYYQGLWDCAGDLPDELSFKRGDAIYILSKVWLGQPSCQEVKQLICPFLTCVFLQTSCSAKVVR